MTQINPSFPSQDERVMAGLAHISALLPLWGVLAPIIIWATQREKSRFVAFHALQALAFQLVMILGWLIGMACYMFSFVGTFLAIPLADVGIGNGGFSPVFILTFIIPFIVMGAMFLGTLLLVIYAVIGGVVTFQGKPFRYFIIGRAVERFLEPNQGLVPQE